MEVVLKFVILFILLRLDFAKSQVKQRSFISKANADNLEASIGQNQIISHTNCAKKSSLTIFGI
jgi:hypothetical protein